LNKEVKEKRDGEGVNSPDEKELHDRDELSPFLLEPRTFLTQGCLDPSIYLD
jgi:hypothetical protein